MPNAPGPHCAKEFEHKMVDGPERPRTQFDQNKSYCTIKALEIQEVSQNGCQIVPNASNLFISYLKL